MENQQLINEGYIEGKKSFEYQWEKIEGYFRWDRVYLVMKTLDWHWMDEGIPSVNKIKSEARRLLYEVWKDEKGMRGTGGFVAGYDDGELWLDFTIEDCHTCDL